MHIVVIGAGAVGSHLAERLSLEGHDVVVIEDDPQRAEEVQATIDCLVITGNGASASVLEEARIGSAGLLIAVTSSDAVNVLACQAAAGYGVPRKIARIEDPALRIGSGPAGVDVVIDPGESLAQELLRLVRKGGVSEMVEFADGELVLLGGFVAHDSPLDGIRLSELRTATDGWDFLVTAMVRNGDTQVARGDLDINGGDHVLLMAKGDHTREALGLLGVDEHPAHKVIVLGATRSAALTAGLLSDNGIQTILIDRDPERCRELAEINDDVVVVNADPTDPRVLSTEGVESADAVLALTGWDEVNILGCLIAKALGAEMTAARFHRFEYVGLLPGVGIDAAVSSRLAAANAILRFVRRGHVHSVATFQDSAAEAIELEIDAGSESIGKSIAEMRLPRTVIVGGVVRGNDAFVPHGDTEVEAGDRLIVFALPQAIQSVEKLFS
jgi:trk system potassium uptake protein TrkA